MIKLCALWEIETKNGETMLIGRMGDVKIMVMKNKFKKEDRHPSHNVMIAPDDSYKKKESQENGGYDSGKELDKGGW